MLVTEFVAPPIASVLMELAGPHFAFLTAIPLEALAWVALGLIRETKSSDAGQDDMEEAQSLIDNNVGNVEDSRPTSLKSKIRWASSRLSHKLTHSVGALGSQMGLLAGLMALVVAGFARPMLELILQYMSVRYGWSLSKVSRLSVVSCMYLDG